MIYEPQQPAEVARMGSFSVLDRGLSPWPSERRLDRGRYAVVEHDGAGPILRKGPYHSVAVAIETCRQLSFRSEMMEDQ